MGKMCTIKDMILNKEKYYRKFGSSSTETGHMFLPLVWYRRLQYFLVLQGTMKWTWTKSQENFRMFEVVIIINVCRKSITTLLVSCWCVARVRVMAMLNRVCLSITPDHITRKWCTGNATALTTPKDLTAISVKTSTMTFLGKLVSENLKTHANVSP